MTHRRNIIIAAAAGVAVAALVTFFIVGYPTTPAPAPQTAAAQAPADGNTLVIPTVDEMCATLGAGAGDALKQCQNDENAAAEYVIAWMGLNNFIANGSIDVAQIQLIASLDPSDPLAAPQFDPSVGGSPYVDPTTGAPTDGQFQSPAQIALYCLGMSPDWLMMHDCISQNDSSVSYQSAFGGLDSGLGDPGLGGAQ
jgi:hypothetical protein